ncbi:uncharacterized protein LOC123319274 [Coccinella septempunctata]|uniref:uncharacterized protein LOC123319274 n=1 Tax=Coccinella septempunctata TaxID=41139 RepID=UPI001D08729D|nr:uncharacterized protein LOC123319274 [Coccinella septempunctata]
MKLFMFRCSKEMNESLGYIFTSGYTSASFSLSMAGYIIIVRRRYSETLFLVGSYALQMVLCRYGQNWEDEHEKLERSLNKLPWYKMTPKMRKNYHILLGTVKIPIQVLAQPFVIINNNLLLAVTRTAYSVLTFMSNTTN